MSQFYWQIVIQIIKISIQKRWNRLLNGSLWTSFYKFNIVRCPIISVTHFHHISRLASLFQLFQNSLNWMGGSQNSAVIANYEGTRIRTRWNYLIIRRAPGVCVRVRAWEPAQLEPRWASRRLLQTSLDRRLTSYPPYLPPSHSPLSTTTLLPSNRGDNSSIPPGSRHYHYLITWPFPWPPLDLHSSCLMRFSGDYGLLSNYVSH